MRGARLVAVVLLAAVGLFGAVFLLNRHDEEQFAQSAERAAYLSEQQRIFAEWYALYQKDVDDLSRNWQQYHHIIDTFKTGDIDLATCHKRLNRLTDDEKLLTERIEGRNLPPDLDDFLYSQSLILRDKIRAYAAAQYRTVALSRAAADPQTARSQLPTEQSRDIQEIMIRESPTGLFIANEVYAVREYLAGNSRGS